MMKELDLEHLFAHADEQVYARLAHIIWKYPERYKNVAILMGGFHQLRVRQKTIHKRYARLLSKTRFVDAGVIAECSADMALEGRHYYRNMRLMKKSFNALIQHRIKSLTEDFTCVNNEPLDNPSLENVDLIISSNTFNDLYRIFKTTGTQRQITVAYIKDVSPLLSLVRSVRDGNFNLHISERDSKILFLFQPYQLCSLYDVPTTSIPIAARNRKLFRCY